MLSDIVEVNDSTDLLIQLEMHQHQERLSGASTPFDSPVSTGSLMDSPNGGSYFDHEAPNTPHRLSVLTMEELSMSPPRINKRKQGQPHRAIKQLASLAEKIINGIIVVEPRASWDTPHEYHSTIRDIHLQVPSPAKKAKTSGRRRRDEKSNVLRSPISQASRSPSPNRDFNGSPANNPNSKPNTILGKHCESDFEPSALAARVELYNNIYRKRKTPGSLAYLGTNRLSGFGGTPLDISQAPGASLLDEPEFELCSLLRLQPLQYFQSRETLLRNYRERGFYKKSAAQKMLHIDVNKTGRLYDFFVKMSWMPETEDAVAGLMDPQEVDWSQLLP